MIARERAQAITSNYRQMLYGFKQGNSGKTGGIGLEQEKAPTITGGNGNRIKDYTVIGNGQTSNLAMREVANTLDTMHDRQIVMAYQNTGYGYYVESDIAGTIRTMASGGSREATTDACNLRNFRETDINGTLQAKSSGGQSINLNNVVRQNLLRRLMPIEEERLQGFPDGWTDIGEYMDSSGKKRKTTDAKRHTAIGNSIALPFWFWLMRRISAQYPRPATLGSLFDGIGGFPLVWERCNGKGTAIWASEIDEFCIAVTKKHFLEVKE